MGGTGEGVRVVTEQPRKQRQRLAGPQALVGEGEVAPLQPRGAPLGHDARGALVGREDRRAHRPASSIEQEQSVAVSR